MKTTLNIIALILLISLGCCSTPPKENEIDRLVSKYQGKTTCELPCTNGKIISGIVIQNNSDNLPWRISLQGNTENPDGLSEIFSFFAIEKMKSGYRDTDSTNYSNTYIRGRLQYYYHIFRKDSFIFALYSKIKLDTLYEEHIVKLSYDFAITNADESRKFGNSSKIDF